MSQIGPNWFEMTLFVQNRAVIVPNSSSCPHYYSMCLHKDCICLVASNGHQTSHKTVADKSRLYPWPLLTPPGYTVDSNWHHYSLPRTVTNTSWLNTGQLLTPQGYNQDSWWHLKATTWTVTGITRLHPSHLMTSQSYPKGRPSKCWFSCTKLLFGNTNFARKLNTKIT